MITKEFIAGEKNLAQEFFSRHTLDDHVIFMGGAERYTGMTDCFDSMDLSPNA